MRLIFVVQRNPLYARVVNEGDKGTVGRQKREGIKKDTKVCKDRRRKRKESK
jgi:hypothetical protein